MVTNIDRGNNSYSKHSHCQRDTPIFVCKTRHASNMAAMFLRYWVQYALTPENLYFNLLKCVFSSTLLKERRGHENLCCQNSKIWPQYSGEKLKLFYTNPSLNKKKIIGPRYPRYWTVSLFLYLMLLVYFF